MADYTVKLQFKKVRNFLKKNGRIPSAESTSEHVLLLGSISDTSALVSFLSHEQERQLRNDIDFDSTAHFKDPQTNIVYWAGPQPNDMGELSSKIILSLIFKIIIKSSKPMKIIAVIPSSSIPPDLSKLFDPINPLFTDFNNVKDSIMIFISEANNSNTSELENAFRASAGQLIDDGKGRQGNITSELVNYLIENNRYAFLSKPRLNTLSKSERESINNTFKRSSCTSISPRDINIDISTDDNSMLIKLIQSIRVELKDYLILTSQPQRQQGLKNIDDYSERLQKFKELWKSCQDLEEPSLQEEAKNLLSNYSFRMKVIESVKANENLKHLLEIFEEHDDGKSNKQNYINKIKDDLDQGLMDALEQLVKWYEDRYIDIRKTYSKFSKYESQVNKPVQSLMGAANIDIEETKMEFRDQVLTIIGYFPRISEVNAYIREENLKDLVKAISIYGFDIIFFDDDLNYPSVNVCIIAPKFEKVKKFVIDLSGISGSIDLSQAQFPDINNVRPGAPGEDGKVGLPGKSSGNFLGICEQVLEFEEPFRSSENFEFKLNGGKGGPGQKGGDGTTGANGEDADPAQIDYSNSRTYTSIDPEKKKFFRSQVWKYTQEGNGPQGGDSGRGGQGGPGGCKGEALLVTLDNDYYEKKGDNGESGEKGSPGRPGEGGVKGKSAVVFYKEKGTRFSSKVPSQPNIKNTMKRKQAYQVENSTQRGPEGRVIDDPAPVLSNVLPESNPIDFTKEIARYSQFVRGMKLDIKRNVLMKFVSQIQRNSRVASQDSAMAIIKEFREIITQKPYNKYEFKNYTQTLRIRIEKVAAEKSKVGNIQEVKLLNYLYSCVMSYTFALDTEKNTLLVIDIVAFLDNIKTRIQEAKELNKEAVNSLLALKTKEGIELKIQQAQNFIPLLDEAIQKHSKALENEIYKLLDDIIRLKNDLTSNAIAIQKKQEKLKKLMKWKIVFGVLDILCQAAAFAGPMSAAIGGLIGAFLSIPKSLICKEVDASLPQYTIPESVKKLEAFAKEKKETLEIKAILEKVDLCASLPPEQQLRLREELRRKEYNEEKKKLEKMKASDKQVPVFKKKPVDVLMNRNAENVLLNPGTNKRLGLEKYQELDKKIEHQHQRQENMMIKAVQGQQNIRANLVNAQGLQGGNWEDNAKLAVSIANFISSFSQDLANDVNKMKELKEAYANIQNDVKNLEEYKLYVIQFYKTTVSQFIEGIDNVKRSLKEASQPALDVIRWQIKNSIDEMKQKFIEVTKGFSSEAKLAEILDKMADAMDTLINLYDRIETYQNDITLVNYIYNINSDSFKQIIINDDNLRSEMNKLELRIAQNLIIGQYKIAMKAAGAWGFLYKLSNPPELVQNSSSDVDISDFVAQACGRLESIRTQIKESKSLITRLDQTYRNRDFILGVNTSPFYTWLGKEHLSLFEAFFRGDPILLYAAIEKVKKSEAALTLKLIETEIHLEEEKEDTDLQNELKNWNIQMTHRGNSHYFFEGKPHIISTESVLLSHSFEKNSSNKPIDANQAYFKLENSDFILSPYAHWVLQLVPKGKFQYYSDPFERFERFKSQLQTLKIHLVGRGIYNVEEKK